MQAGSIQIYGNLQYTALTRLIILWCY